MVGSARRCEGAMNVAVVVAVRSFERRGMLVGTSRRRVQLEGYGGPYLQLPNILRPQGRREKTPRGIVQQAQQAAAITARKAIRGDARTAFLSSLQIANRQNPPSRGRFETLPADSQATIEAGGCWISWLTL